MSTWCAWGLAGTRTSFPLSEPIRMNSKIEELRNTAALVAREKALYDEKRDELHDATGEALQQLCAAVEPALPAVVQRVTVAAVTRYGPNGKGAVEEPTFLQLDGVDVRGVFVAGSRTPQEDLPRASSGKLRGRALWLLEDGRFLALTYAGTWSSGAERSWTAQHEVLAPSAVGAHFKLSDIMMNLSATLAGQRRGVSAGHLAAEAEKVRAVSQVLAGLVGLLK